MAAVKMYITKFDREVLIDDEHPLAVAEVAAAVEAESTQSNGEHGNGDKVLATSKRKRGR